MSMSLGFDFSKLGRKVILYHTHPEGPNLYEELMRAERFKQQFEKGCVDETRADGTVRKHIRVSNALPSRQDIESMKGLLVGAKAEIDFGIATPIGITDLIWDPEAGIDTEVLSALWFASIHNMEDIHDPDGQLSEGEYVQRLMEEINRDLKGSRRFNKVSIAFRPQRVDPVPA